MTNDEAATSRKDKSFAYLDHLPDPNVLTKEIADNLESALGV